MDFVLNRNKTHASTLGHVINFKKGIPTHVPPSMHAEVMGIGGIPVGELPDEPEENHEKLTFELREEKLMDAIQVMYGRVNTGGAEYREDFNAAGLPNIAAIKALSGITVDSKERSKLWAKFLETHNEGD